MTSPTPDTVNLVLVRDALKREAIKLRWCSDAERAFEAATGVELVTTKQFCGCCIDTRAERFVLPDDAPESVPLEPVVAVLKSFYKDHMPELSPHCSCCDGWEGDQSVMDALQRIADVLPGAPKLADLIDAPQPL